MIKKQVFWKINSESVSDGGRDILVLPKSWVTNETKLISC